MKNRLLSAGCLLLVGATAASASTVAFEDHALLSRGKWQLNSILYGFPDSQKLEDGRVSALAETSFLTQFAQEFRYGLSDRVMLRTTLPLSFLNEGSSKSGGLGDWEVFCKAGMIGEEESPFQAALGLQLIFPTAFPGMFGINGSINVIPSLMCKWNLGPGALNATVSYARALEHVTDGETIHPSDSAFLGLGYSTDLSDRLNLGVDALYTETLAASTNGQADDSTKSRQLTAGPGFTYSLAPHRSLLANLQLPWFRQGNMGVCQPCSGLLMFSQDF